MCCLVSGIKLNCYVYLSSFFINYFINLFIDMFIQCECVACLLNVSTAFCLLGVRTLPVFNFLTRTLTTFSSYTYVTVDGF